MLIRNITYKDLDGVTHTDKFHFNLDEDEFAEFAPIFGDVDEINQAVKTEDVKALVMRMRDLRTLILASYGERSEDGKHFLKNDTLRENFRQHRAFAALFHELTHEENAMDKFFKDVLPEDLQIDLSTQNIETTLAEVKDLQLPPAPPLLPRE